MPKRCRAGERYLLAPGEWLPGKERYKIEHFVGQGAFGAAYKATTERGEVCFVKEWLPPTRPSEAAELARVYGTERDIVRRIGNYELAPRFWDAFEHEGYFYLITDFIPGPDVETILKNGQKPDEETLTRWCVCLCQELSFIHSRSVVHHDLKPANIRLNADGDPVIVDFGAAHWYRVVGETTDQLYGSDSYLAPEYAERSVEDADSGKRMDVFAMGRILVELMVGERLTQEEIDKRHSQIYGSILHSGKLDISFVRAVFKSVAYDPQQRYASGIELAEDITPAAPPVGRVRPSALDFGLVEDAAPKELNIQCYNVGGGTLHAEVAVEGDWLEVGTTGAVTGKHEVFDRNRQAIRVIAYPERVQPGAQAAGRLVLTFQNGTLQIPVHLRRAAQVAEVHVQPTALRLNTPPGGAGSARLTFANRGSAPTTIRVLRPVDWLMRVEPEEFVLAPGGKQEVMVTMEASTLGDREAVTELRWTVEGNERPNIPLTAAIRRGSGLLNALSDRFRKKA